MGDNKLLPATGTGTASVTVATDEIAGIDYQRVKAVLGADGTAVDPIAVSAALDSTGAGVQAVGALLQFDDASVATVTENQYASPRISSRRAQLVEGVASGTAVNVSDVGTGTNAASQVTVTNSSTTIIASRAGRRGVLLLNRQTVAVSVDASGGSAVYATHFVLDPGASVYLPVTSAVTGITSAAYTASGDAKVHLLELF